MNNSLIMFVTIMLIALALFSLKEHLVDPLVTELSNTTTTIVIDPITLIKTTTVTVTDKETGVSVSTITVDDPAAGTVTVTDPFTGVKTVTKTVIDIATGLTSTTVSVIDPDPTIPQLKDVKASFYYNSLKRRKPIEMPNDCYNFNNLFDYTQLNANEENIKNYHPRFGFLTQNLMHDNCNVPIEDASNGITSVGVPMTPYMVSPSSGTAGIMTQGV